MKKVSRISLHNLSKAELANNEMYQLRGGSGAYCVAICWASPCRCPEGYSGAFHSSAETTEYFVKNEADVMVLDKVTVGESGT